MSTTNAQAQHRLSPSSFGRAFEVACERHFKLSLLTLEQTPEPWLSLKKEGQRLLKERLTTVQILAAGHAWEEEALTHPNLAQNLIAPPGDLPLSQRRWGEGEDEISKSLEVLQNAPVGALIYQLKLRPPHSLYQRFNLDPTQISLRDNLPDLIQVLSPEQLKLESFGQFSFLESLKRPLDHQFPKSERIFRVIDLKRSAKVKPSHRAQVFYYATELDELITQGQLEGQVDLEWGGVWLGGTLEPERISLSAVAPYIIKTLQDLPNILENIPEELDWTLSGRCEYCDYWQACSTQAQQEDHLSRLTGLSKGGAEAIRTLGVHTVAELPALLAHPEHEKTLMKVASLEGKLPILQARAEAYQSGRAIELKRLSQILPQQEDIAVFVTVQQEPVGTQMWAYGLLVRDDRNDLDLPKEPYVEIVNARSQSFATARRWLSALDETWQRVHFLNHTRNQTLSLQVYCYSDLERRLVQRCLSEMRVHPYFTEKAVRDWSQEQHELMAQIDRALHVIQGAELMGERQHPREVRELPVIPLLSALVGRYALPIDVVYTLPEVVKHLHLSPEYPRHEARHDPYNHQLKPDGIIELWEAQQASSNPTPPTTHNVELEALLLNVVHLKADLSTRLQVYQALLAQLRASSTFAQVRRLTAFKLPHSESLSHPDLSRLSFLTRQERLYAQREVKQVRFEGAASAKRYGTLTRLRCHGEARFEVLAIAQEQGLEVGGFGDLILVEASEDGLRRAAMISDDESSHSPGIDRTAFVKVMKRLTCARSESTGSSMVEVGDFISLCDPQNREHRYGDEIPFGLELFLCERFTNFTDHKLHKALKIHSQQHQKGTSLFVSLLEDVRSVPNELRYTKAIEEQLLSSPAASELTISQKRAWEGLTRQRMSVIWGPPGTGKTHFLASYVLGLIYAHEKAGLRINIVLSAMTNAGIDHLIDKVAELAWSENQRWGAPLPILIRGKKAQRTPTFGVHYVSGKFALKKEINRLEGEGSLVLGVTQWALADLEIAVDLLIIDEASQLLVQQASIGFTKLTADARIIVAGDHKQLGPVLKGDWGRDQIEQRLTGSIFDLIRGTDDRPGIEPFQLLENFRMCRTLTALSQAIYGAHYQCANEEIAQRTLKLDLNQTQPSSSTITRLLQHLQLTASLSTASLSIFENPLPFLQSIWSEGAISLVILHGAQASRVNVLESALVGLCVESLRLASHAQSDHEFWSRDLFVIGPHNRQNDLTREALKAMRTWSVSPFVQTVDKAQGQEASCVIISYGVSDLEFILAEQNFIYNLNRLNVSITRAQSKLILFLSRPLLDGDPSLLNHETALAGLSYMQRIEAICRTLGTCQQFALGVGQSLEVLTLT